MPQIGIVGPAPSVERILSVIENMKLNMDFIPFCYTELLEAADIVSANQQKIDGWLFSGPSPYLMVRDRLEPGTIAVSCQHIGAGLYRGILQISHQLNHLTGRVSIDMPQGEEIEDNIGESLEDLKLPTQNMYVKPYTKEFRAEEMIAFHRDLFRQGLTEGAVTSLYSLYLALKKENIPVVHNTITKMEITLAIRALKEKVNTAYFRNTQVGVEIIDVGIFNEVEKMLITPYQLQELELDIKRILIRLSKKLDGYLMEKGSGRYEIFSSRGAVERELQSLSQAIEEIRIFIEAPVSVGIGFGESVHAAEIHAYRAINHAKTQNCSIVMIQDDGVLVESPGKAEELQYSYFSHDGALLEKLKEGGVSVKIYQKIIAVLRRMGWNAFTVNQLAEQLAVTPRNISRIMTGLVEAGLAECVGQEAVAERGRPSKIFRINH